MFCPNCGEKVPDQARFCPKCGSGLASQMQSAPAPTSQAPSEPASTSQAPSEPESIPQANHPKRYSLIAAVLLVAVVAIGAFAVVGALNKQQPWEGSVSLCNGDVFTISIKGDGATASLNETEFVTASIDKTEFDGDKEIVTLKDVELTDNEGNSSIEEDCIRSAKLVVPATASRQNPYGLWALVVRYADEEGNDEILSFSLDLDNETSSWSMAQLLADKKEDGDEAMNKADPSSPLFDPGGCTSLTNAKSVLHGTFSYDSSGVVSLRYTYGSSNRIIQFIVSRPSPNAAQAPA